MKKVLFLAFTFACTLVNAKSSKFPYQNPKLPISQRVEDLMSRMSLEEKVDQMSAQLLFMDKFYEERDYTKGHVRNVAHFLWAGNLPNDAKSAAQRINEDTKLSMEANRWGIPVLQHGEALHGAQWGNATCFPQSISMAATFDTDLYHQVALVIAKELRAVGVRQVYAPVVNISRDQRWGRAQESYGEDVLMNSAFGVAYVKALEGSGVVTTPKHYVDNYGEGGHDSYPSPTSWRVLREVYLEPFRACFQEGGSRSVMSAYNSIDGVPVSCNERLLNQILRDEWGFDGYVVCDYGAVSLLKDGHFMAETHEDALAMSINSGLDLELMNTHKNILNLVKEGKISEETVNESVRRILKIKFELGLFEDPFVNEKKAAEIVRCDEHKALAEKAARKCMTLLKNNGILPLDGEKINKIGIYGPGANQVCLGDYSGPYGGWRGEGAVNAYQGIQKAFEGKADVVLNQAGQDVNPLAQSCDVLLFFPAIMEDEGSDRSSFKLPSQHVNQNREDINNQIIDEQKKLDVAIDQEKMIRDLIATGKPVIVVLQNGSVIDITDWVDGTAAVLEAWYPGEQGGTAIADVLTGKYNPGGRLPFSWVKSIGQNPMYYSVKPSGRNYSYVENDGKPLYPFGYGLSYTTFEYSNFEMPEELDKDNVLKLSVIVTNTGKVAGDEVVQVYMHDEIASVGRPLKELVAFKRVTLSAGESKKVEIEVPYRSFHMWDKDMKFRVEEGWFNVWLGKNAEQVIESKRVYVK
ncbi:MAG: glycoside hydrolase family 3 C-terminal domain-containing protein [Bacteroides sp.]|nr:glycoside hydrolase family 3 C-terminal domain-containing protein [Bacteroides sp.]